MGSGGRGLFLTGRRPLKKINFDDSVESPISALRVSLVIAEYPLVRLIPKDSQAFLSRLLFSGRSRRFLQNHQKWGFLPAHQF